LWDGFKSKKEKHNISRGQITMKSYVKLILTAAIAVLLLGTFAAADTPGSHPAYLHALTDLRHARAHLERMTPNARVDADEQRAIEEIDAAIGEVKEAAIDDGKNLNDHPPVDSRMDRQGRLRRAMELLDQAHNDIDQHESDGYAKGLKKRALHHIDEARKAVHHAIEARHYE
jgi:hypothetical protein